MVSGKIKRALDEAGLYALASVAPIAFYTDRAEKAGLPGKAAFGVAETATNAWSKGITAPFFDISKKYASWYGGKYDDLVEKYRTNYGEDPSIEKVSKAVQEKIEPLKGHLNKVGSSKALGSAVEAFASENQISDESYAGVKEGIERIFGKLKTAY
jgi:hypothetical protein